MTQDLSRTFKIVTVWLVLGIAVFLGFKALERQRERMSFVEARGSVEIRRGPDGHFHWPGTVNGVAVDFLVDTGATSTALPRSLADRVGLESEGRVMSSTANGTVRGELARADIVLQGHVQAKRLRVTVLPGLSSPLLGMDVLGRMQWSVAAGVMRIEPLDAATLARP
ncbi:MAG: family clan aspartic protease [Rhizobacter sp.]|nr:family clan aspartic protease [Rhizobacter sp.]